MIQLQIILTRYFSFTDENLLLLVESNTRVFGGEDIPALATRHSDHMEMVRQGGYTYISELTTLEREAAEDCKLVNYEGKVYSYLSICRDPK